MPRPSRIERTGDDSAATSVYGYVWRMTGWHQAVACGVAVLVAALNLAPIELQRRIVNEVVETQNVPLLLIYGAIYLGVLLAHQAVKFGLRMYQTWLAESTMRYTRRHLLGLYDNDSEERQGGTAVSIIGSEVEKLGGFVGEALSEACANVALLVGVLGYMLVVEPGIALFAIAFMVPQIVLTPFMQAKLNVLVERRVGYLRDMGDEISDLDGSEKEHRFGIVDRIFINRMKFALIKFMLKALLNLLNALGPLAVLLYGGYLVMMGETQVGVIVAFISGFDRIAGPVRDLVSFYRVAQQAEVQHTMIAKWMSRVTP